MIGSLKPLYQNTHQLLSKSQLPYSFIRLLSRLLLLARAYLLPVLVFRALQLNLCFASPVQMEMRANYEDSLQEVRTLELQQETLLFQVDCLQDALESTEEMLAETQRENHTVTMVL